MRAPWWKNLPPWPRTNAFTGAVLLWALAVSYHVGIVVQPPARGDLLTRWLSTAWRRSPTGYVLLGVTLAIGTGVAVGRLRHCGAFRVRTLPTLSLESAGFAGLLYLLLQGVQGLPLAVGAGVGHASAWLVACGAGIHEELLFRGALLLPFVGHGSWPARGVSHGRLVAGVVCSALLFAAAHPLLGDEGWHVMRLVARSVAGLLLGWICLRRGLAAAALTHAGYNAMALS